MQIRDLSRAIAFILIITLCPPCYADEANFVTRPEVKKFIHYMVKKYHFKQKELTTLFRQVKVRPIIIQSMKAPLEQKPWHLYQYLFINEWRIRQGLVFWNKYENTLAKAEKIYGVPASIIVATIGIETKYGQNDGIHRVIDALSNPAFNHSNRANFFLHELEEFLLLTREQRINPLKVMGSYAGAIGQPQFMPSSYRLYAVNFSNSGKINLSDNEVDVIGSIANYYNKHGWQPNQPITIPASLNNRLILSTPGQHFSQLDLAKYGIKLNQKTTANQKISVIALQGRFGTEYWLTYNNFDVIKRYNASNLYAMAVFQLSDYIAKLKKRMNNA